MKVMDLPSVERFRASSDLELKLVTIWSLGIGNEPRRKPPVVRLSRTIGDVMPKLASAASLLKTPGYVPSLVAMAQATATGVVPPAIKGIFTFPAMQPGGSVSPTTTDDGLPSYTLRLSTSVPGKNSKPPQPSLLPCAVTLPADRPSAKVPAITKLNAGMKNAFFFMSDVLQS